VLRKWKAKHQEVADLPGVTVGTSKSQLFYAKKKPVNTSGPTRKREESTPPREC
jgi:DNA-directed RNA polymerase specialized sigma24 family protein